MMSVIKNNFFENNHDTLFSDGEFTIDLIKNLCVKHACKLNVVYIPNSKFWRPNTLDDALRIKVKNYADVQRINFIDGTDILDSSPDSPGDYASMGPHLSAKGYANLTSLLIARSKS